MLHIIGPLITSGLKIGSELIQDKDKKEELAYKYQELIHGTVSQILAIHTVPWVDAMVKVMMALNTILKGFARPVGAFAMAGFGAYCKVKGIELGDVVETTLFGAPLAWGVDRSVHKARVHKTKQSAANFEEDWGD